MGARRLIAISFILLAVPVIAANSVENTATVEVKIVIFRLKMAYYKRNMFAKALMLPIYHWIPDKLSKLQELAALKANVVVEHVRMRL